MIKKIPDQISIQRCEWGKTTFDIIPRETFAMTCCKTNELVDAVNKLETMARNTNTVLKSLVEENNIHEQQIDKLQMMLEPHKCETRPENVQDPYAEQRKWIGKLCFFWNNKEDTCYAILGDIIEYTDTPFEAKDYALWYEHCEPVKPDDDIIYKGGDK